MGMGLNFIVSPDQLEEPPQSARSCIETSMVPESESEAPSETSYATVVKNFSVASKIGMMLGVIYLLG